MLQKELRKVNRSKEQHYHIHQLLFQNHVLGEQQLKLWSVMKMSTSPQAELLKGIRHHLKEIFWWLSSVNTHTHAHTRKQNNKTHHPCCPSLGQYLVEHWTFPKAPIPTCNADLPFVANYRVSSLINKKCVLQNPTDTTEQSLDS